MAVLIDAGADMLACETIPCLAEARALVRLLSGFPNTSAWFTFTSRDETRISHGETIAECALFLDANPQVAAVGVNCTSPLYVVGLIRSIRAVTHKPIIVYPNSGEIYDAAQNQWLGETSCDAFGEQARTWYGEGARIIGGCCRTTPDHIREISTALAVRAL
jgi:homocysteine S-methyltransferase